MDKLKEKFESKIDPLVSKIKKLIADNGDTIIGEYSVKQVYSGLKGVIGMVTETSKLDAEEGIRFRGYSIPELRDKLPKASGGVEPLPEGIFYLMLMGELPNDNDALDVSNHWARRSHVPKHVFEVLDKLPVTTHPMTQLSIGIMALQTESVFANAYRKGINKKLYWDPMYEDVMNLIARLPRIAAYIYRRVYKNNVHIEPDPKLDWAANFAHMLGFDDPDFYMLMRLYLTLHADHEGGNVSAHTTHLVGSALSDAYMSLAAGLNGLAGPLHGLANQEVMRWILDLRKYFGGGMPDESQIAEYIQKTLDEGKVIPGYGHAVLRKTDPRFLAQMDFANKYIKDDELVRIVHMIYNVAPGILQQMGKVKNPWPNVDAHSGVLLVHYGLKEYDFYTVLFGVSRAMGVLSSLLWDRAIGNPIERPGSITTEGLESIIQKKIATV